MSEEPGDRFDEVVGEVLRRAAAEAEAGVDWAGLRARVTGWRSKGVVVFVAVGTLVIFASLEEWLGRIARPSETGSGLVPFPFGLLFNVVALGFISWHLWRRWRDVQAATSPRYLTHLYRQDLVARIRSARAMVLIFPGLLYLLFGPFRGASTTETVAVRLLAAVALGIAVWSRFVELPRLEREEQDLPFFDDFPHLF